MDLLIFEDILVNLILKWCLAALIEGKERTSPFSLTIIILVPPIPNWGAKAPFYLYCDVRFLDGIFLMLD